MDDEKLIEILQFIKGKMEESGRTIDTYRYIIHENDLYKLPSISNLKEFRFLLKEYSKKGYLKQIELGIAGSYAMTEYGFTLASEL